VNDCARCGGIAGDMTLCETCGIGLRIELTDIPDLLTHLDITRSRQDKLTPPYDHGSRGGEIPLPYRPHVADVVWVLHSTLATWARTIEPALGETTPTADLATWFLTHLGRVRMHPDAAQLVDEVTDAVHQARRAIDRPNDHRLFLGPCGNGNCRTELYGVPWRVFATCEDCGAEYKVRQRQDWLLEAAQSHLGTAPEIAGFLRITGIKCTPAMIRSYAHRERLAAAGVNQNGHPLYRIRDVITAIHTRHENNVRTRSA
jgi:hypothetical protein